MQSFKDRYGDDAKKVMYATATKQAMEEFKLGEGWKKGKYKVTDGKTGKVLGTFNSGSKAQKFVDDLFQKGDYEALTVELIDEEAPANSVAGGNVNLDPFVKKKRKNAKVETESFGGQKVFVVSPQRYFDSRLGKSRYDRYEKYVGKDKLGEAIRQYGRTNPKAPIILKNSGNGAMLYLKYGRNQEIKNMAAEELQSVKLEVGLLKNEVEVRGKQIETLLQKLDLTTDKLQQLTVQIIKLNTRQEDYLRHTSSMSEEFKILHTRIGDLHDKQLAANKEIEQRLDRLDQYKSKLMGMIIVVGGVVGTIVATAISMFLKD